MIFLVSLWLLCLHKAEAVVDEMLVRFIKAPKLVPRNAQPHVIGVQVAHGAPNAG